MSPVKRKKIRREPSSESKKHARRKRWAVLLLCLGWTGLVTGSGMMLAGGILYSRNNTLNLVKSGAGFSLACFAMVIAGYFFNRVPAHRKGRTRHRSA